MKTARKLIRFAFLFTIVAVLLAFPKREDTWTCPDCLTENDAGRGRCMNGCGTEGPLAPSRGGDAR
jgi:hypothetical protein